MDKRISIIIPTYYRNDYLKRAIDSVLAQTYQNFEILVIDDSKDGHAKKTVDEIISSSSVVIHYLFSGGVKQGAARNMGFQKSSGEIIAVLDDDDWWTPNKLELDLKYFKKYDYNVVVYGGRTLHSEDGKQIGKYIPKYFWLSKHMIKLFNFVAFPALSFPKAAFERVGYLDETLSTHEDWDFLNRLALHYKFVPIKEVQAKIFKHASNRDKEHFDIWEKDKLEVFGRYKSHWSLLTWILYAIRQMKLKLHGRKY